MVEGMGEMIGSSAYCGDWIPTEMLVTLQNLTSPNIWMCLLTRRD
jgi:hypothetical protein